MDKRGWVVLIIIVVILAMIGLKQCDNSYQSYSWATTDDYGNIVRK